MNYFRYLFEMLIISLFFNVTTIYANDTVDKPHVMVLGTFHFQGSSDLVSEGLGDMLSERRQNEILEVLNALKKFNPTKIALEFEHKKADVLDKRYSDYLNDDYKLTANEIDQLGFRLAKMLGHKKIYAVDHQVNLDFGKVMKAAEDAGQTELLNWFQNAVADVQKTIASAQSEDKKLMQVLHFHNSEWAQSSNAFYVQLAEFGDSHNPIGAEVVSDWYERNLKIYSTIASLVQRNDERILVIYGSGHLAQLLDFFEQNPKYKAVSALEFIAKD